MVCGLTPTSRASSGGAAFGPQDGNAIMEHNDPQKKYSIAYTQ